jgi:hypothetical protein
VRNERREVKENHPEQQFLSYTLYNILYSPSHPIVLCCVVLCRVVLCRVLCCVVLCCVVSHLHAVHLLEGVLQTRGDMQAIQGGTCPPPHIEAAVVHEHPNQLRGHVIGGHGLQALHALLYDLVQIVKDVRLVSQDVTAVVFVPTRKQ